MIWKENKVGNKREQENMIIAHVKEKRNKENLK